jgi:hypothetical protein
MRFTSLEGNFVLLRRHSENVSGTFLLAVEVRWRGLQTQFNAQVETWILQEEWLQFSEQLHRLEESRKGSAIIKSISPKELSLSIHSIDLAGHVAIEGFVGYRGVFGETSLSFAPIEFDPSLLPDLVRQAEQILRVME